MPTIFIEVFGNSSITVYTGESVPYSNDVCSGLISRHNKFMFEVSFLVKYYATGKLLPVKRLQMSAIPVTK